MVPLSLNYYAVLFYLSLLWLYYVTTFKDDNPPFLLNYIFLSFQLFPFLSHSWEKHLLSYFVMAVESTTVGGELIITIGFQGGDSFHETLDVFGDLLFE